MYFFFFIRGGGRRYVYRQTVVFFSLNVFISTFIHSSGRVHLGQVNGFPNLFVRLSQSKFFLGFFPSALHFVFYNYLPSARIIPVRPASSGVCDGSCGCNGSGFCGYARNLLFPIRYDASLIEQSIF